MRSFNSIILYCNNRVIIINSKVNPMKSFWTFILALFTAISAFAQQPIKIPIPIVPKPIPTPSIPKPRTPVQPDIEAYYGNEMLTFIFNRELGDADIVVTNLTTGDIWSGSASGICSTTILLSGDEGYYQISIFTENEEYFGEFSL